MDAMLLYSETPNLHTHTLKVAVIDPGEIYSTGVLSPGAPVNITVWSYVDQLGIAVLTDDRTFNDPHEPTDALTASFGELRSAAGISA
jgi:hypothetical protein